MGSLALAIGVTAATFSVVMRALRDPLPFANGDRIVDLQTEVDGRRAGLSFFVSEDLRDSDLLADVAATRFQTVTYEAPNAAERLDALEVTPSYFKVLGVQPALGAVWAEGATHTAIVSWPFFERTLAGDREAIGRRITIDGVPHTVVGVMPESFGSPFGLATSIWTPLPVNELLADSARGRRTVAVIGLLKPEGSFAQFAASLEVFGARQRARYPGVHERDRWVATPLRDALLQVSLTTMKGIAGAAVLLLVIVWAAIAGLSAAHAAGMQRAAAVRSALGASTLRLFGERLRDSLVLAAAGTATGLWLADTLVTVARSYQLHFLPNMRTIAFGATAAGFGVGVGLLTALIIATLSHPALRPGSPAHLLKSRGATGDRGVSRIRAGLVVVQVAVAIVLLVGGGLLVRTVQNLSSVEMGFETGQIATFRVNLPGSRYQGLARHLQFERDVLERVRSIQGISDATASVGFPAAGVMGARLTILQRPDTSAPPDVVYLSVSPGFVSFLDLPVTAGRDIAATDTFESPRVVVINETMARMFWPAGNAVGAKVKIGAGASTDREITVVGIVSDVRQHGPAQDVRPTAYGSTLQYSWPRRDISVKVTRPLADLAADLRAAVHAVDPLIPMPVIAPFDEHLSLQTARHRLLMLILVAFGIVASGLCGFGLYAVVALTTRYRRREFAIRLALGAKPREVVWVVFRQSAALGLAGAGLGLVAAAAVTQTLQGLLHGVSPTDQWTYVSAAAVVVVLAIAASVVPAHRARRISPAEVLQSE